MSLLINFFKVELHKKIMKNWLILLFLVVALLGSVSATITNVHISPEYPNLSSQLVMVNAEINNESGISYALLHYQISTLQNVLLTSLFFDGYATISLNPKDNAIVSYQIEAIDNLGGVENSSWFTFTYDGSAPIISINGNNPLEIEINSSYEELGATALDDVYGDLTSSIIISGNVDTTNLGEYTITYDVSDLAGNIATATRLVRVIEQPSPVSSSSGGGSNSDSSSSSENEIIHVITNGTETNTPESSNNPTVKETDTKAGITGKSIVELIGQNKGTSIIIGILAVGAIVGWFFLKRQIKRKLWGK